MPGSRTPSRGRLGRQFELELVEHELEFGLRLGVAGELDLAPVGGWNVDVDQLQGGELLQDASWGEAWASAASRLARVACRQ